MQLAKIELSQSDIRELLRCISICLYDPDFHHGDHTPILYERLIRHLRELIRCERRRVQERLTALAVRKTKRDLAKIMRLKNKRSGKDVL